MLMSDLIETFSIEGDFGIDFYNLNIQDDFLNNTDKKEKNDELILSTVSNDEYKDKLELIFDFKENILINKSTSRTGTISINRFNFNGELVSI